MTTVMETSSSTTTRRRKRSKTEVEVSPDGDSDKRRGRPLLDKQDESAADRRRTQIRMAQRAYRQRKESTLEELRKRVSELTTTIERMNRSFLDFSARAVASGASPSQAAELEELARHFETLVKDARNPAEDAMPTASTAIPTASSAPSASNELEAADLVPQVRNVPSWLDRSAVSSEANRPEPTIGDMGLGYAAVYDSDAGGDASLDLSLLSQEVVSGINSQQTSGPGKVIFSSAYFDDDYDLFPIPSQPSPPRTFSFQESTFARRLHRACLERAYQLLLDPDMRPATYERVFRLSLLGRSRAKIINVIKIILARGPHQDLDFWEAPLIHVGGAGTHYPPRDAFGNVQPKRQSRNIGRIGPQTLALLDNASREQISLDMTVEIAGYEGEWFDSDDVQGYLEEKNIFIDPSSTFAEADMIDEEPPISNDSSTTSTAQPQTPVVPDAVQDIPLLDAGSMEWDDLFSGAGMTGVGFSDAQTGSWMNFLQPGESIKKSTSANEASTQALRWSDDWMDSMDSAREMSLVSLTPGEMRRPRTKKVVIDVRKLVKALATSGVCLGRSPGFRRKDVDHAISLASMDAF